MKKIFPFAVALLLLAVTASPVFAGGTIRLDPHSSEYPYEVMLESPATFSVYVTAGGDPTTDPHIFLVMTESSYLALSGAVTVNWTDPGPEITISAWTGPETLNSKSLPTGEPIHSGTTYNVATLQDHLFADDEEEEPIYWAFAPMTGFGDLTGTPKDFTVTLPSTAPRMLVYIIGQNRDIDELDNRVPPTQPGLVIPELPEILLIVASFSAFALYAAHRRSLLGVPRP